MNKKILSFIANVSISQAGAGQAGQTNRINIHNPQEGIKYILRRILLIQHIVTDAAQYPPLPAESNITSWMDLTVFTASGYVAGWNFAQPFSTYAAPSAQSGRLYFVRPGDYYFNDLCLNDTELVFVSTLYQSAATNIIGQQIIFVEIEQVKE